MKTEILKILSQKNFFTIVQLNGDNIRYCLKKPSILLMQNAHVQWLQSIWLKADKHFPVYLNNTLNDNQEPKLPFGIIDSNYPAYTMDTIIEHNINNFLPEKENKLKFSLMVPDQDIMQHFFQWQRYRKYWWSSITSTPGLFSIRDIKYNENVADVDICTQFPWGKQIVEKVSINTLGSNKKNGPSKGTIECSLSPEAALMTTLADGMINSSKEEYLRLHRKMAPYKISYAIQCNNDVKSKSTLQELAVLLNSKLEARNMSTWFPQFVLPLEHQIKENLGLGVVYTAILSEKTLVDGIFNLLNSSTMLQEQTHVADFESYVTLLFQN